MRSTSASSEQARPHFEAALEAYDRGDYRAAAEALERALALDPDGKDLLFNLAVVHERLGEHAKALVHLRALAQIETDEAERARVQRAIRRIEGAAALARAPREPSALPRKLPPTPAEPPPVGALVAGGVAAVATLVGAAFSVQALTAPRGKAEAPALVADVSLLVAVASGSLAWWLAPRARPPECKVAAARRPGGRALVP